MAKEAKTMPEKTPAEPAPAAPVEKERPKSKITVQWQTDREFVRVWRSDWPDDVFEIMTPAELDLYKPAFERFNFPVEEVKE